MTIATWGVAMVWSATAGSFGDLLLARLALGAVTAAAGPVVASLVGDWFNGHERGQIYSYILSGELHWCGRRASLSPVTSRRFRGALLSSSWRYPRSQSHGLSGACQNPSEVPPASSCRNRGHGPRCEPLTQIKKKATRKARPMLNSSPWTAVFVLTSALLVPLTRVWGSSPPYATSSPYGQTWLSSCRARAGTFSSPGCKHFGSEFVTLHYRTSQVLANLYLLILGVGALAGVLVGGPLGDLLLHRGRLSGRVLVAAFAATASVGFLAPALLTSSAISALPYLVLAAAALTAQNPPIDAARLDIMPSWLWGRAEGIQTFLRSGAQALAPLLFGLVSDRVFGGGGTGLKWTFITMLVPLAASAFVLFWAARRYPTDVATAGLVTGPEPTPQPS